MASRICLNCKGPSQERNAAEVTRSGVSMLSLDALQENHHESEYDQAHDVPIIEGDESSVRFSGMSTRKSESLQQFFRTWLRRSTPARDTIAARLAYPEKSNKAIAALVGVTEAHVSNIMLSFFDEMEIKGRRNKRRKA
jgi:hypothetical protein